MDNQISIYDAIEEGDLKAVHGILKQHYADWDWGGLSWNPLHEAAKRGTISVIKLLLEYGIPINSVFEDYNVYDDRRGTALTEALINSQIEAAKFLIKNGADVNSVYYKVDDDELESIPDTGTSLSLALLFNDEELIDLMVENGLDADVCDRHENTALFYAISNADKPLIFKLLEIGADVDQEMKDDERGRVSALVYAVLRYNRQKPSSLEIIELLLKKGASLRPQCVDCEDETVIDVVLEQNSVDLDRLFGLQNVREELVRFSSQTASKQHNNKNESLFFD